jgi:hypothetical protein
MEMHQQATYINRNGRLGRLVDNAFVYSAWYSWSHGIIYCSFFPVKFTKEVGFN